MYISNCLKSLILTILITDEDLSRDDDTIYSMKYSFLVKMNNYLTKVKIKRNGNIKSYILRKMVPHPPLFNAPTPCSTPPFFKIVVSPHLCFIALPFRQYHPHPHANLSCTNPTNQPFLV